ncbi:ATP-binding protein [Streptomyces sp. F63]|uniref:ATP-binding protein n=1 Tax=Streptomyces sp. F63 TaxID=2824887 RepID=UPI001B37BDBF|nr:ATP-binding protein [Streptomyces sp. F63]MBQ0983478.1 ATP-binding protein [Streptomyces sp. F63]
MAPSPAFASRGAHADLPDTADAARPVSGTLVNRAADGRVPAYGTPANRANRLDLVFDRAEDGDPYRWPGRARVVVTEYLMRWELAGFVDEMRLLVSELVSNAVRHGWGDRTSLHMTREDGKVHLTVAGESTGRPGLRDPGPDEENGRGLQLVDHIADVWGTDGDGTVWCSVSTAADEDPRPTATNAD